MTALPFTELGKLLGAEILSGESGLAARVVTEALARSPEYAIDIIDSLIDEGAKPEPDDDLVAADVLMLATALESVRCGVEAGRREAMALADRVRRHLIEAQARGHIEPRLMPLILNQFVVAKLDVGPELQAVMLRIIEERAGEQDAETLRQGHEGLHELGGDPFDIHACLTESAEALPEPAQVKLAVSVAGEADERLANAALGFLLSSSAKVRAAVARSLAGGATDGAARGRAAPVLLRRTIALRAWLPASERPALDEAVERMRQTGGGRGRPLGLRGVSRGDGGPRSCASCSLDGSARSPGSNEIDRPAMETPLRRFVRRPTAVRGQTRGVRKRRLKLRAARRISPRLRQGFSIGYVFGSDRRLTLNRT